MTEIRAVPLGDGRTRVSHPSGAVVETDSSPEWGGKGRSFSATDLVAAALGACVTSSIVPVIERRGVTIGEVEVRVSKTLATDPKRIDHLVVHITIPGEADDKLEKMILRAAATCAVGRSLASTYEVVVG